MNILSAYDKVHLYTTCVYIYIITKSPRMTQAYTQNKVYDVRGAALSYIAPNYTILDACHSNTM